MATENQELPVAQLIRLLRNPHEKAELEEALHPAVPNGRCQTPALCSFGINTVVKFAV